MKPFSKNRLLIAALLAFTSPLAVAGHIDPLGINLSTYSNDGAGNFQLKYEQYFSVNGFMWNTGTGAWNPSYTIPTLNITGAPVTGPAGPINITPTNSTDPSAPFAGIIPYTIPGYDRLNPPIITISVTDCCHTGDHQTGTPVTATLAINSSVVVTNVPEPAPLALLGLGLAGLGFMRRRAA